MISSISDIYNQLSCSPKLIQKWKNGVVTGIKRYARNVSSASPFLDKPQKRMFGVKARKNEEAVVMYGTSPNAGRVKGFTAPVNEWIAVNRYFHIMRHGKWRTIHKVHKVSKSIGVPVQDVPYYGTSEKPEKFFGIKKGKATLAYGSTKGNIALPVYARDSFVDWLIKHHRDELDNIILECGRDVLADIALKGGGK